MDFKKIKVLTSGSYFSNLDENSTNNNMNKNNLDGKRKSTENNEEKRIKIKNKIQPETSQNSEQQMDEGINKKSSKYNSDLMDKNETNTKKGIILKVKPFRNEFNDEIENDSESKKSIDKDFDSNYYLDFTTVKPKNDTVQNEKNIRRGLEAQSEPIFLVQENNTNLSRLVS